MLCHEFIDALNRMLDERGGSLDELLEEHARSCRVCRQAWRSFQRCERALAQSDLVADERLTDRVLNHVKRRSEEHRRRKRAVVTSFSVTIAAGLLALSIALPHLTREPDATLEPEAPSNQVAAVAAADPWSQWYSSQNLPGVNELWNFPWPTDRANTSMSESVSSGLRPVAETMNSAFKVIRQNVLPTAPQAGSADEQAGHYAGFASIA